MNDITTIVISRTRGNDPSRETLEGEIVAALDGRTDVRVILAPHLYDAAPDGPVLKELRACPGNLIIVAWLYPRATHWLLDANDVKGTMGATSFSLAEKSTTIDVAPKDRKTGRTIWCLDFRGHETSEPLLREIEQLLGDQVATDAERSSTANTATLASTVEEQTKMRWYPLIDYGRCKNCMECLNFCLFGVFGVDEEGQLFIEQPDACRDGCPACSRVCPSHAIIFPHHNDPAVAGDPKASTDGFNTNLVQLLGPSNPLDIAAAERDRALAEKAEDKATQDSPTRKDALDELVDDLDEMEL